MKVSYCICTHNEGEYVNRLLSLVCGSNVDDEVVVVDDYSDDECTIRALDNFKDGIQLFRHHLAGNFAEHKNFAISKCGGDIVFNIDADEYFSGGKLKAIRDLANSKIINGNVDVLVLPRINMLDRITPEYERDHNVSIVDVGGKKEKWIDFPDWQRRVWKNHVGIRYAGNVHEELVGYSNQMFCSDPSLAIEHVKTFDRQMKQNELYRRIIDEN